MAKQKKNQTTGTCKHCGQQMIVHLPEGWDPETKTQDEYDQLATEQCECAQAMKETDREKKKAAAIKRMTEYYDAIIAGIKGQDPMAKNERKKLEQRWSFMNRAIETVADNVVSAAAIQISKSEMMTIGYKANGDLQIKRVYKGSEEWIF